MTELMQENQSDLSQTPVAVGKKKVNPLTIVVLLIVILLVGVGGIYAGMQISKKQTPIPLVSQPTIIPTKFVQPTSVSDETANWKTYTNTKYGFEFMYPQNLNYVSLGSNSAQKEVDQGKEISGTVVPSFDTINFREGDKNKKFSVEIFKENETALTPKNYQNGLYMSGSCDLRWLDNKPSVVKNTELNGNNLLEVNITGPKQYVSCYYIKNRNGNLIVISSEIFTDKPMFEKINEEIIKILSTFKFTSGQNQVSNKINITLPVTVLNTDFGITGVTLPPYPKTVTITIPTQYSDKVAVYGVSGHTILAPKGWTGKGLIGASGSDGFDLYPIENNETGSKISVEIASTGTGPAFYNAAPFFSWARTHFPVGIPTPTPIPGLTVSVITSHLVAYSYPAVSSDIEVNGIAFSDAQDHEKDQFWSFEKMEVVLPKTQHDLSTILLNNYIQQRSLDKK